MGIAEHAVFVILPSFIQNVANSTYDSMRKEVRNGEDVLEKQENKSLLCRKAGKTNSRFCNF